jgi:glycosyltransferase involved in cell wall biosynthesis
MFYGLPVVCSAGDGTERHLVREGYNGAFFRGNDAESMAQALIRILSDQEERARMGVRSREIIDREVNIRTVVAEYMKAFRFAAARAA